MNIESANAFLDSVNDSLGGQKSYNSNSFKEEYEWLKKNLPYALPNDIAIPEDCYKKCPSI